MQKIRWKIPKKRSIEWTVIEMERNRDGKLVFAWRTSAEEMAEPHPPSCVHLSPSILTPPLPPHTFPAIFLVPRENQGNRWWEDGEAGEGGNVAEGEKGGKF